VLIAERRTPILDFGSMVEISATKHMQAASSFEERGYELLANMASRQTCDELSAELSALYSAEQKQSASRIGGIRNLLDIPAIAELASSPKVKAGIKDRLGKLAFPVRAIFFDKTQDANWQVQWHQDLSIAVAEHIETPDFTGWSLKNGIHHVQPPTHILETMVTLRLHLDDCNADNGALKVIPGSHRFGKIPSKQFSHHVGQCNPFVCECSRGDALLMRPLLLHSSSPAKSPLHRRVLHVEYATAGLPNGLRWFYQR
jgi:hypothetical protein